MKKIKTKEVIQAPLKKNFFSGGGFSYIEPLPNASKYDNQPTQSQIEKFEKDREKIVSPIVVSSLKKHPEDVLHGSRSLSMLLPVFREPKDWDLFSPKERTRALQFERSLDNKMKADISQTVPITLVESMFTSRQPGNAEKLYRVVVPQSDRDAEIDVIEKPKRLQTVRKDGITHESLESQYKRLDIRKEQITQTAKATGDKHAIEDFWKSKGLTVLPQTQSMKPWNTGLSKGNKTVPFQNNFTNVNWLKNSNPWGLKDTDRDRIPDMFDCAPLDPYRQGVFHNIAGAIKSAFSKGDQPNNATASASTISGADVSFDRSVNAENVSYESDTSEPFKPSFTTEPVKIPVGSQAAFATTVQNQTPPKGEPSIQEATAKEGEQIFIDQPALKEKSYLQKKKESLGFDKLGKTKAQQESLAKDNRMEKRLKEYYEKAYEHYFYRDSNGVWQYFKSVPLVKVNDSGEIVEDRNWVDHVRKIEHELSQRFTKYTHSKGNPRKILQDLRDSDSLGKTYTKNLAKKMVSKEARKEIKKELFQTGGEAWASAKTTMGVKENVSGPDKRWGYNEKGEPEDTTSGMPKMALAAWGSTNPSRSYSKPQMKRAGVKAILSPDEYKSLLEQGWTEEDLDNRGVVSKRSKNYQEESVFGKGVVPYRPISVYQAMVRKPQRKTGLFMPTTLMYEDVFFNPLKPRPRQEETEAVNLEMNEGEQV